VPAVPDGFVAYGYDRVDIHVNHFLGFTGGWLDGSLVGVYKQWNELLEWKF